MRIVTVLKTGTGCLWTVPILAELVRDGHDVVLLVPEVDSPLGRRCAAAGVGVLPSPAPVRSLSPLRQAASVWRLRALLRQLDPDVLHYHLYAAAVLARLASAGRGRRRRPVRVHMVAGPLYLENPVIRAVERRFLRMDDVVICSSGHLRERHLDLGVAAERLPTASYGVDLEAFVPAPPEVSAKARADLGLDPSGFVAVCVAYFYPPKRLVHRGSGIKGHEVLLRAWSLFRQQVGDGTLILVGGGHGRSSDAYRQRVRTWASGLPAAETVVWTETTADVRPYYAAADVSVSPSLSENYGAVAEASACAVPSIASAVGGLPELVDTETGWLVPAGDPTGLAAALAAAYEEHGRGDGAAATRLHERGTAARARAEVLLDQRRNVRFVAATIVEATCRNTRG